MINKAVLLQAGIDFESGVKHMMDDEALYELVLATFVVDDVMERARKAYDAGDYETMMKAVHEAKGSCGNADLQEPYQWACKMMVKKRGGDYPLEENKSDFLVLEDIYGRLQAAIKESLQEEGVAV